MKQATFSLAIIALLGAMILAGCSTSNSAAPASNGDTTSQTTFNNGSGPQPFKPVTHLLHRALVTNFCGNSACSSPNGALDVVDATQNRVTTFTFAVGSQPTYMQPSPDGTLTLVNNTGSGTLSSFNNLTESQDTKPLGPKTIQLNGVTESFVTDSTNKFGFAAVPGYSNGSFTTPGAIVRFNPTDASLNTPIPFPDVRILALDRPPVEKHLLAFTDVDDSANWVDLTTIDTAIQVPPHYMLALTGPSGPVSLSHPVAAFFSADNGKAFILSCGFECGGSSAAKVTEIDTTSIVPPSTPLTAAVVSATVVNEWTVKGARRGLIDPAANKLYVAGSSTTVVDSGGNNVQDGWFTTIDLSAAPASNPIDLTASAIQTGNGVKRWIRNIGGTFWIASLNCGVQSCVTLVNPVAGTATVLSRANGDATGITDVAIHHNSSDDVYTIEGGELFIYDQQGNPVSPEFTTDIVGQGSDVLYIN